jgi:nucleoside-diphosphate-sugar epimerase
LSRLLILGAGYLGAALAELALQEGHDVTLADNWYATERQQLEPLQADGARIEAVDIRQRHDIDRVLADPPDRVYLTAAQASRPLSERDPDYTEQTNLTGARRVAEAVSATGGLPLVYLSSLQVYGPSPDGDVDPGRGYGEQRDLAHMSKVYAELCLSLYARRTGFPLALLRLGVVYGRSPVEHSAPESETVVNKFRRLVRAGEPLPLDAGGAATIGVVDVRDACRIMLEAPDSAGVSADNVAAETLTVADIAALAEGREPAGGARARYVSRFSYQHWLSGYLAP